MPTGVAVGPRVRTGFLMLALAALLGAQGATVRARLAAELDAIPAIDHHTHLLEAVPFDPEQDRDIPLPMRNGRPAMVKVLQDRFGVTWDPAQGRRWDAAGREARRQLEARLGGEAAYWADHLRAARVEVALVNQLEATGTNGGSLRWVPTASPLLLPLPAPALEARSPLSQDELGRFHGLLLTWMKAEGLQGPPPTLEAYLHYLDRQLRVWQRRGAVALKFVEAYHRTLAFREVPRARAEHLWAQGRAHPLNREDTLALQDFLARHLFREAGRLHLPVHFHTGLGGSPRLRLREADPLELEPLLTDPRFDATDFVLIHAGGTDPRRAAALAAFKPNVWLDLSALAFYLAPEELAAAVRTCLLLAPERTLFGTDAFAGFQIPVGAEVAQLTYGAVLREALTDALTGLVKEGVLTEPEALRVGRGVLRGNARRLYRWKDD
ncbi:MAG TPA: amidohydrolase family protein [Holophagaceae bacterium]|nr:amidohydrolase family protein [Holophagaceae bacterium]